MKLIFLLLAASTASLHALDLRIPDVPTSGNVRVTLRQADASPEDSPPPNANFLRKATSADGKYRLALSRIDPSSNNAYFIYEFLVRRSTPPFDNTRVSFNVDATSKKFDDFDKEVPFEIIDGSKTADGKIWLPFHPVDQVDFCKMAPIEPLKVYLSGDTPYTVSMDCTLSPFLPREVWVGKPNYRTEWGKVALESDFSAQPAPPKNKVFRLLTATITPNLLSALGSRLRRLTVKGADDVVTFEASYALAPAGLAKRLSVEIPIVFYPSILVTVGSLFFGVFIGWIAILLLLSIAGKWATTEKKGQALGLGILLSMIAYLLALLAYSTNCRLQLFGLDVNPSDELVLFGLGLLSAWAATLKVQQLLDWLNTFTPKPPTAGKAAAMLMIGFLLVQPVSAFSADKGLSLVGLSACPNGTVIGLHTDGSVIVFPEGGRGGWRRVGMIQSSPIELTCAEIEGRMTAFVLSDGTKGTRLIRMDISTGKWNEGYVAIAAPGGIAFDPKAKTILVSSHSDKGVHRIPPSLIGALPWAFVFGDAASIGPLAVDMSGSRVLVADDYSGVVYSFAMVSAKQSKLLQGLGRINSMSIDLQKNLLYIADSGKRTVWVTPLSGLGVKKPDKFVSVSSLKSLTGVAIDLQSRVWVSSLEPARVIVFGPNGKQVAMFQ